MCYDCIDYQCIIDMHADGIDVPPVLMSQARRHLASHQVS